jgi:hypothetical protein
VAKTGANPMVCKVKIEFAILLRDLILQKNNRGGVESTLC